MNGIIDPLALKKEDLPVIVLVDDRRSLLGWLVKQHSSGGYNHIMEMHYMQICASQDPVGFREVLIEKYMKPFILLKFYKVKDLTLALKMNWIDAILTDLEEPWYKRRYDYLGIIGHMLRIPWLNNSHLYYCSERVAKHVKEVLNIEFPEYPTPSDINAYLKTDDRFELLGYYFTD